MIKPDDVTLLISFFGLSGDKVEGRTRIQKDICILKHEHKIPFNFSFEPYFYGPYSAKLTDVLDILLSAKLLRQDVVYVGFDLRRYDYCLTSRGKRIFKQIERELREEKPELFKRLRHGIDTLEGMSIAEVVSRAKECSGIESI